MLARLLDACSDPGHVDEGEHGKKLKPREEDERGLIPASFVNRDGNKKRQLEENDDDSVDRRKKGEVSEDLANISTYADLIRAERHGLEEVVRDGGRDAAVHSQCCT